MTLYETAAAYLKEHLNGRSQIPLPSWKAERSKLTAEKSQLNQAYAALKNEVAEVEKIQRGVYDIMHEESRQTQHRWHDMDL